MLLAIVDGRQPGYSVGITLGDLADILYQYGAYQACNLDGGSSADGFVMGWGKCAGGTMKNHYPKGLRWVGK